MMQEAIGQRLARALAKVPAAPWEKVQSLSHSRSCDCAIESEIVTHYDCQVDRQLFRLCPQPSGEGGGREGVFVLNTNAQEAVIALGIYLIESGYRHVDRWSLLFTLYSSTCNQSCYSRILDYLLCLHRGLSSATFPDEFARDRSARLDFLKIFAERS